MRHWDGATWSNVDRTDRANPGCIWGASGTDIWFAGLASPPLRSLAGVWGDAPGYPTNLGSMNICLWGASETDVWVVGQAGLIEHWDGTTWTPFSTGAKGDFYGVWGTSTSDVWAWGTEALGVWIVHWDGVAWSVAVGPGAADGSCYGSMWGPSAQDVWLAGCGALQHDLLHWDGSSWSVAYQSEKGVYAVWGTSAKDVWGVGEGGTIIHWDGAKWVGVTSPTGQNLNALWGSGANDIWAVGDFGVVLRFR